MTAKRRNPVAKNMNEFNKPKTFRDRKTHAKNSGEYGDKPHRAPPYKRERLIDGAYYTLEDDDEHGN